MTTAIENREISAFLLPKGPVPKGMENPDLYRVCQGFEAYFMRNLVKELRGSMNLMGGGGAGAEIYQGMFESVLGGEIAKKGAAGIAETMYRQMMSQPGKYGLQTDPVRKGVPGKPVE